MHIRWTTSATRSRGSTPAEALKLADRAVTARDDARRGALRRRRHSHRTAAGSRFGRRGNAGAHHGQRHLQRRRDGLVHSTKKRRWCSGTSRPASSPIGCAAPRHVAAGRSRLRAPSRAVFRVPRMRAREAFVQCATWRASASIPAALPNTFAFPPAISATRLRLPDAVPFADAALIEPLACVVKSLRRGGVRPAIASTSIGLGVMGLLHVLAARDDGRARLRQRFHRVRVGSSRSATERRRFTPTTRQKNFADGADVVICGPGTPRRSDRRARRRPARHGCGVYAVRPGDADRTRRDALLLRRPAFGRQLFVRTATTRAKRSSLIERRRRHRRKDSARRECARRRSRRLSRSRARADRQTDRHVRLTLGVLRRHRFRTAITTSSLREVARHATMSARQ